MWATCPIVTSSKLTIWGGAPPFVKGHVLDAVSGLICGSTVRLFGYHRLTRLEGNYSLVTQIFIAADDELGDLVVGIAAQRVGQRHVAHRLVVPGVAAADERPGRVRQAASVGAELIAPVEVRRLR